MSFGDGEEEEKKEEGIVVNNIFGDQITDMFESKADARSVSPFGRGEQGVAVTSIKPTLDQKLKT